MIETTHIVISSKINVLGTKMRLLLFHILTAAASSALGIKTIAGVRTTECVIAVNGVELPPWDTVKFEYSGGQVENVTVSDLGGRQSQFCYLKVLAVGGGGVSNYCGGGSGHIQFVDKVWPLTQNPLPVRS